MAGTTSASVVRVGAIALLTLHLAAAASAARRDRGAHRAAPPAPPAHRSAEHAYASVPWYPYSIAPPYGEDTGRDDPAMVYAGSARISTSAAEGPPIPEELRWPEPPGTVPAYFIVHFRDAVETAWKEAVTAAGGVSAESYIPNHALVYWLTPDALEAVRRLPFVDWVGRWEPAYKVSPLIGRLATDPRRALLDGRSSFTVTLFPGASPEAAARELASRGLHVADDVEALRRARGRRPAGGSPWHLTVRGHYAQVLEIVMVPEVQYVEEAATVMEAQGYSAAGILQSGSSAPWASLGALDPPGTTGASAIYHPMWITRNLRGQRQVVGITENVDYDHALLSDPVTPRIPTFDYSLKVPRASLLDGSTDICSIGTPPPGTDLPSGTHGTLVAGACCQDWHPGSTFESRTPDDASYGDFGEAIAHEAQIVVGSNLGYTSFDYNTQRAQWLALRGFGASVLAASWAWCDGATTTYTLQSQLLDDVMNADEKLLIANAAGNKGVCPTFDTNADCQTKNWAKGPIDVGASDDLSRFDAMVNVLSWPGTGGSVTGSSLGPDWSDPPGASAAKMIFPDVASVADDTNQSSDGLAATYPFCGDSTGSYYTLRSTSAAAATVAGTAALVHQYFEEGNFPPISDPSGALVKAVLVNATERVGTSCASPPSKRPGGHQGWGRPNLSSTLAFLGGSPTAFRLQAWDVPNAAGFSASGQFVDYPIDIVDTTQPLKVTLCWLDVMAAPGSPKPFLVNNLDLRLVKGATTYRGNNVDPSTGVMRDPPGTGADAANVIENVFLSTAQVAALGTGPATIRVTMANAPTGRNQGHALVVVGGIAPATTAFFDQSAYTCLDSAKVYTTDTTPSPTVTVAGASDTETLTLAPSVGPDQYEATFAIAEGDTTPGNGILGVADGITITATYETTGDTAAIECQPPVADAGKAIRGGCDAAAPPPPDHPDGIASEGFTAYMDDGESVIYEQTIRNTGVVDLADVRMALAFSGPGAPALGVYGANPAVIGPLAAGASATATFSILVSGGAPRAPVSLDFLVTSPADGYTVGAPISQAEVLNADDLIFSESACFLHDSADMNPRPYPGRPASWALSGSATCGAETRTDGPCDSATLSMYKTAPCGTNAATGTYDILFSPIIQPVNQGAAPGGEVWKWRWRRHSFYAAAASATDPTLGWQMAWEPAWASASPPATGAPVSSFELFEPPGWFNFQSQTAFANANPPWDWDPVNLGTPDAGPTLPPDQHVIDLTPQAIGGDSTSTTRWLFAHQVWDVNSGNPNNQGFGIDDDRLAWDEYYRVDETTNCSGSVGVISLDREVYTGCPSAAAIVSVLDGNAAGPVTATVTSSAGDSEQLTLTGTPPFFQATLPLSTAAGEYGNDGTLLTGGTGILTATYADASPSGSSSDDAVHDCASAGGDVIYRYFTLDTAASTGDDDRFPDHNETWRIHVTIRNDRTVDLANTQVVITTSSPYIDCITDGSALYGTVAAGATATNPPADAFQFHVQEAPFCTDPASPRTATFNVLITGTGYLGPSVPQSFTVVLDLDAICSGNCVTPVVRSESFNTNPGWATGVWGVSDCDGHPGCAATAYVNEWGWGATEGNASGGYGAPVGLGNYASYNDGYVQSPTYYLAPAGPYTMSFQHLSQFEAWYDALTVWVSRNGGSWDRLVPSDALGAMTGDEVWCNPLCTPTNGVYSAAEAGFGTGSVNLASIGAQGGDSVAFRWRQSTDNGGGYFGARLDAFSLTSCISGTFTYVCDANANGGLPGCCPHEATVAASATPVCAGDTVTLTATVTGASGPVTYQWLEDGAWVPGATGSTLLVTKGTAQTHAYNVLVTAGGCTTKASAVTVTWQTCFLVEYDGTLDPSTTLTQLCGDGDAVVEPGEQWNVRPRLVNAGTQAVTNVVATLSVNPSSPVMPTVSGNPASYGNMAPGGTAQALVPYSFTVPPSAACGSIVFDLVGIASTQGSYPAEAPAFTIAVGSTQPGAAETRSQAAGSYFVSNTTVNIPFGPTPFTLPLPIDTATVTWSFTYTQGAGPLTTLFSDEFDVDPAANGWTETGTASSSSTAPTDTCAGGGGNYARIDGGAAAPGSSIARAVDTTGYTNIRLVLDHRYDNMDAGEGIHVEASTAGLAGPWSQYWSRTSSAVNEDTAWTDDCGRTVNFFAGANNNPNFAIRIRNSGSAGTEPVSVDHVLVRGNQLVGNATDNIRTQLVGPAGGVTTLKDFGAPNAPPYTPTAAYVGPGTYQLRVTENAGGTANVSSSSMTIVRNTVTECDVVSCNTPPGEAGKAGPSSPLRARKGIAGAIELGFANACSATGHAITWSDLPFPVDASDWSSSGCAFMDADGSNATYDVSFTPSSGADLVWFVVSGHDTAREGSYGRDSSNVERPGAGPAVRCQPQLLVGNCN